MDEMCLHTKYKPLIKLNLFRSKREMLSFYVRFRTDRNTDTDKKISLIYRCRGIKAEKTRNKCQRHRCFRLDCLSAEDADGLLLLGSMKSITVSELDGVFSLCSSNYNSYVSLDFCLERNHRSLRYSLHLKIKTFY